MTPKILNVFPSQSGESRLVLAQEFKDDGTSQLVLRQETQSEHVGWFVQSRILIEPDQVAALKMTLTSRLVDETPAVASPTILRFGNAMAG